MHPNTHISIGSSHPRRAAARWTGVLALLVAATTLLVAASPALASKDVVDFIGDAGPLGPGTLGGQFGKPGAVAVNESGAGGVPAGTIYVTDSCGTQGCDTNNRIQRFVRDDHGTPAETADDTYAFVAAWGAGVSSGSTDYEICTVAASCRAGQASGGNGTAAGNGALSLPRLTAAGIAVDQDTGDVYVVDMGNSRVNVYSAAGAFRRSFGWDVVASGPDDAGTGYEICVAVNGDVCKAGVAGLGTGQLNVLTAPTSGGTSGVALSAPDGNVATGKVFVTDFGNRRIDSFGLDGSAPASIGSAARFAVSFPQNVAVDSRGIVYADNATANGQIERYDSAGVNGSVGFLAPIAAGVNKVQRLTVSATSGTFRLTLDPDGAGPASPQTTADIPYNATASAPDSTFVQALNSLAALKDNFDCCVLGGPGDAGGTQPYTIRFSKGLGASDAPELSVSDGSVPLAGGTGATITTTTTGQTGLVPESSRGTALAVDQQSDVLFVTRGGGLIQQLGPTNAPGLTAPPGQDDERHNTASGAPDQSAAIAVEHATGRIYLSNSGGAGYGVFVLDNVGLAPTASLDALSDVTDRSVTAHATIDPNGPPDTRYHYEYSADEGATWTALPDVNIGHSDDPQVVADVVDPAGVDFRPNTTYRLRLVAGRTFGTKTTTDPLSFTTARAKPLVQTTGAPNRTATTAELTGRVAPQSSATSFHFEYGTTTSYEHSTPATSAGAGDVQRLVGAEIHGLDPSTTYHYRLVADNAADGPPVVGADMTVTTRADDAPLSHGARPGPPGSDRAWEQVNMPDTGGNPMGGVYGISDDGNRVAYAVFGGTPLSDTGTLSAGYLATRTDGGWRSRPVTPPRSQLIGTTSFFPSMTGDLSSMLYVNQSSALAGDYWRLRADGTPDKLATDAASATNGAGGAFSRGMMSADGSRAIAYINGTAADPAYPGATALNLYDISSTPAHLVSLLPGNVVAGCGVIMTTFGDNGNPGFEPQTRWVGSDGRHVLFESRGSSSCATKPPVRIYRRDLVASTTELISGTPVSGLDCDATLSKSTDQAAYFVTRSRLTTDDTEPASCNPSLGDADVYRYDYASHQRSCLTCGLVPGVATSVAESSQGENVVVSEDGSRIYFRSLRALLPGAPRGGSGAIYRLRVSDSDLALVSPDTQSNFRSPLKFASVTPDGENLTIISADAADDTVGGATNGGTSQLYRYDDTDGSLVCVSCLSDGTPPTGDVNEIASEQKRLPNINNLAASGTIVFGTPTPLLASDHNTDAGTPARGQDLYEWRDGRLLLLTDGASRWNPVYFPEIVGIAPSGRDVFIRAAARYTPDAPDSFARFYDARIGGGFDFSDLSPTAPCALESCQGPISPPPALPSIGSISFVGDGNVSSSPSVGVLKLKAVLGSAASLKVRVPGAGRISVAGSSIRRTGKSTSRAGTYSVRIALGSRAKKSLKKRRKLKVDVRVSYRAKDGRSASKTVTITFKLPQAKRVKAKRGSR